MAGVDRIFKVGGAQAVAALAYGTESIPKVDKIVGPGGIFVATAKQPTLRLKLASGADSLRQSKVFIGKYWDCLQN